VDSARLAVTRPGSGRPLGGRLDAFFPFSDGLEILIAAGSGPWSAGRSVRDAESLAVAQAAGVTMYLTGTSTFAH